MLDHPQQFTSAMLPFFSRARRRPAGRTASSVLVAGAAAVLVALAAPTSGAGAQNPRPQKPAPKPAAKPAQPAPPTAAAPAPAVDSSALTASVQGLVIDSLHLTVLPGALVRVDGTTREALTDQHGNYRIVNIPPGPHRLVVLHSILDTLGVGLVTQEIPFAAGDKRQIDVAIPSGATLVTYFCPPARRVLGPAALVGTVLDADTEKPAVGAKASLLWYESDPLGLKKTPRIREAPIDSAGHYRLCGLPSTLSGKLQIFRGQLSTGEVPVELHDELLGLRSMSIASAARVVATVPGDSGKPAQRVVRGSSRVSGRVVGKSGQPVAGARVGLQGNGAATLTRANGEFVLDSLPAGTQTLEVRKLGFSPTEVPVELSPREPARVAVKMDDYVPVLQTMRVVAQRENGLRDVGFLDRKRTSAGGYFMEGDQINKNALEFTDVMRNVPGVRVVPVGNNQYTVVSSRDATGGCVNFYVDGSPWQSMEPGDINQFVRPDEVEAMEVYSGANAPPQFTQAGQGGCASVVIWTVRRVMRKK